MRWCTRHSKYTAQRHDYPDQVCGLSGAQVLGESDNQALRLLMIKDPAVRVSKSLETLFPTAWLEEKGEGDPRGRTNREIETEVSMHVLLTKDILFDRLFRTS